MIGPGAPTSRNRDIALQVDRSSLGLLIVAGACLLALGIGLRDPWPADEPRFALIAQEMLQTGDFWLPRRAGELYPDKPPVFMWLSALAIAATGSVRVGFLLPSLLAALGTVVLVADLVRRLYGRRAAWMAAAALLVSVQFVLQAKTAQIDMVLTFFTTLAAYGLLRHALLGPATGWWLVGWAACGLGILSKGVGFVPLLMLPTWAALAALGQAPRIPGRQLGAGFLVLLCVVAAWGLPMILVTSFGAEPELVAYRDDLLFRQTGERYAAAWHHVRPWYFYVAAVAPWAWLPLTLALPWAVPVWWREARRGNPRILLPLSGVVLILIFFSLSPGKRGVYILPALPLLVIAMAPLLQDLWAKPGVQRIGGVALAVAAAAFLAAGGAGFIGWVPLARLAARYGVEPWAWWTFMGLVALMLLAVLGLRRGMLGLVLCLVAFWIGWSTWGYRLLDGVRSPRDLMQAVAGITGAGDTIAMPDFDEEFLLQARQPMVHFGRKTKPASQLARAFAWFAETPDRRWMLVEQNWAPALQCVDLAQAKDLGFQNSDTWWLIPGTAFSACKGDAGAAPLYLAPTTVGTTP